MPRSGFPVFFCLVASAGAQWTIQDSHTTADLRGIDFLNGGVAWASGNNGAVLRTDDGGTVWRLCAVPHGAERLDFRGVQAIDGNTAVAMSSGKGDLSRVYKTSDGCQTWRLVLANPDKEGFFDAVRFSNGRVTGDLIGDPVGGAFVIYKTVDSGETWQRWANDGVERMAAARANESIFAASNTALAVPGVNGPCAFVTGGAADPDYSSRRPIVLPSCLTGGISP